MRKYLLVFLSVVLMCTALQSRSLAENPTPRSSNYFSSYGTSMSRDGNGVLGITFDVMGMGICSQLGVASYEVERRNSNGNWEDASGLLEGETGSNVASYTFSRSFNGVPGETYRVQATFCCFMNGGCEFKNYTSPSVEVD